jgi:hypothetical protein
MASVGLSDAVGPHPNKKNIQNGSRYGKTPVFMALRP